MLRSIALDSSVNAGSVSLAVRLAFFAVPLLLVQIYQRRFGLAPWDRWHTEFQLLAIAAAVLFVVLLGAPTRAPFIYFQF
jgi:hypothetical protein